MKVQRLYKPILIILLFFNLICMSMYFINDKPKETDLKLNKNVLITAAHLGEIEGYTLLYSDEDRDTAYYLRNDRQYTTVDFQHVTNKELGDCIISEVYLGGFTISVNNPNLIHSGLSGSRIMTTQGKEIGFISALLPDGKIDCKTLE